MPERSKDWMAQAERDLQCVRHLLGSTSYEWACFIAQQAAEKAAKAVYQQLSGAAWGHSVTDLLKGLEEKTAITDPILECARRLDRFYIVARYPNGWASGFPGEYITQEDARGAIRDSEEILRFCKDLLEG